MNLMAEIWSAIKTIPIIVAEDKDGIADAFNRTCESSAESDTPAKFAIGFKITIDVEKHKTKTTMSYTVAHKSEVEREFSDPKQTDIKLEDKE